MPLRNRDRKTKNSGRGARSPLPYLLVLLAVQVVVYVAVLNGVRPSARGNQLTLDHFNRLLGSDQIREATILDYDSRVTGTLADGTRYWMALPRGEIAVNNLANTLANADVATKVDQQTFKGLLNFLSQWVLPLLLFATLFGVLLVVFLGASGIGGFTLFGRSTARRYRHNERKVTFADVAGLDETVTELEEVKDFLSAPDRFSAMGARVPRGVLLTGPPGCGKTLLARAVAGEADVPFFSIAASEFAEMLVGVGAARVRDLFREARLHAPSIIFIDELDAVGRARGGSFGGTEERDQTLNEMLVQMDGFNADTRVVVLAATNRFDILDEALTRPGRFDRHVVIDRPDLPSRQAILAVHVRNKPMAADVDLGQVARRTPGFSGADLANVINEAALLAARTGLEVIGRTEVDEGIDRVLSGPERRSRILTPIEKRRVAVHEAGHALVAWALPGADPVDRVSVISRGASLGHTQQIAEDEQHLYTRTQLTDRVTVFVAGRLAEIEVFGEASNGAADDLRRATDLARHMVMDLGMGEGLPALAYRPVGRDFVAEERSDRVAERTDAALADIVGAAEQRARSILADQRIWLDRLAQELEERETLQRDDVEAILHGLERTGPVALAAQPR